MEDFIDIFVDDEMYIIDEGDFASAIYEIIEEIDNFSK